MRRFLIILLIFIGSGFLAVLIPNPWANKKKPLIPVKVSQAEKKNELVFLKNRGLLLKPAQVEFSSKDKEKSEAAPANQEDGSQVSGSEEAAKNESGARAPSTEDSEAKPENHLL